MDEQHVIEGASELAAPAATEQVSPTAAPLMYTNLRDKPDYRFGSWVVCGAF